MESGKVFALKRTHGNADVINKFEFVGGKVEEGEENRAALKRECLEELEMSVEVGEKLAYIEYDYPEMIVHLHIYLCKRLTGYILKEHSEYVWMDCETLKEEEWAPADAEVLRILKKGYISFKSVSVGPDLAAISAIAKAVFFETYLPLYGEKKTQSICSTLYKEDEMREKMESGYEYMAILLNGEAVGLFSRCLIPQSDENSASSANSSSEGGAYLADVYLKKRARGRGVMHHILNSLPRPVYICMNTQNKNMLSCLKHMGYKISDMVSADVLDEYPMEQFILELT